MNVVTFVADPPGVADNLAVLRKTAKRLRKRKRKAVRRNKKALKTKFCDPNYDIYDPEIKKELSKYYSQRYVLFSKYDEGIQLDRGKMLLLK